MNNMNKILLFLITLIAAQFSSAVWAKYNPNPDAAAYRLGVGDKTGYGTVYYACNDGDDDLNDGLTPETPYKTYAKAAGKFGTLPAGGAIAFCRGGSFTTQASVNLSNQNATSDNRVTIRDYQMPTGSKEAPKIIVSAPGAGAVTAIRLGNSTNNVREGVIVKNLHVIGANLWQTTGVTWGISLSGDVDHILFENIKLEGLGTGINASAIQPPQDVVADEVMDDLTFTHNVGSADTITRATGTWSASIKRGNSLIISGSASNDGAHQVESVAGNVITLTDTTDGIWDVVDETGTASVTVSIKYNDAKYSFIEFKDVLSTNNKAHGLFMKLGYYNLIHDSEFSFNGWGSSTLDHNIYISNIEYSEIYNNELHDNGYYQGGVCKSVSLVGHGVWDHVKIRDNLITQPENKTFGGCYGIAIDNGYSPPNLESFTNMEITGNTLINMGLGIGCNACVDTLIDNNLIYSTTTVSSPVFGIAVPDRDVTNPLNPKTSNVTISNNKLYGTASGSWKTHTGSKGIRVGNTADDTEGAIDVLGNTIDNTYDCINNNSTGGATITITGNTTTNCTTGEQP